MLRKALAYKYTKQISYTKYKNAYSESDERKKHWRDSEKLWSKIPLDQIQTVP